MLRRALNTGGRYASPQFVRGCHHFLLRYLKAIQRCSCRVHTWKCEWFRLWFGCHYQCTIPTKSWSRASHPARCWRRGRQRSSVGSVLCWKVCTRRGTLSAWHTLGIGLSRGRACVFGRSLGAPITKQPHGRDCQTLDRRMQMRWMWATAWCRDANYPQIHSSLVDGPYERLMINWLVPTLRTCTCRTYIFTKAKCVRTHYLTLK